MRATSVRSATTTTRRTLSRARCRRTACSTRRSSIASSASLLRSRAVTCWTSGTTATESGTARAASSPIPSPAGRSSPRWPIARIEVPSRDGEGRRSAGFEVRVAIVRQRYTPFGGAERFVARALPALERAGADVTLITRSASGWGARRMLRGNPFYVGNLWRDWSFSRAARKRWLREGFDFVQSHERIPGCEVYRAGDGVHRRWLELRRAAAGPLERLGIVLNPYHRYVCRAEKRMFEHARLRAVICNSRMVQDQIKRGFRIAPEKLHVIYNGVDLEHFHPRRRESLRGAARAELGCAPRDTLFLFVGSGFARKGLGAAVDALAQAANEAFRLVIVGHDREERRFMEHARRAGLGSRVRFLGARDDVRPLYAA